MTFTIPAITICIPEPRTLLGKAWRLGLLALLVVLAGGLVLRRAGPASAAGVTFISAGAYHTCAVTTAGGVKCWGANTVGQLGDGTTTNRSAPVDVMGLTSGVGSIRAGGNHTCALTTGGGIKCWGDNGNGELGDGTTTNRSTPVDVCATGATPPCTVGNGNVLTSVALLGAGAIDTCAAILGSRQLKCWGYNADGEVGDGTTTERHTPVDVTGLTGVVTLAGGGFHACAGKATSGDFCWGQNLDGQLGNGTTTGSTTPVGVTGLTTPTILALGTLHSCALLSSGGVECWGFNGGTLGDGGTCATPCSSPVSVTGLTSGVAWIAAGGYHSCAVTTAGGAKCWGDNTSGDLGDGTTTPRSTPVDVTGLTSNVYVIAAGGGGHTCALTTAGGVECWGDNSFGQLGNGTTGGMSTTPVNVTNLAKTEVNISLVAQYHPPESCYNVYNPANQSTPLFQVCDNSFGGAPATSSACIDATHPTGGGLCSDLDPAVGSIRVLLVPGDYHVVQTTVPPLHVASPGKTDCNTSSVPKCGVTLTTAPHIDPWFPWDTAGSPGPAPDGKVSAVDILAVVQKFGQTNPYFASPAP